MNALKTTILLIICILQLKSTANTETYTSRQISQSDGLSHHRVNSIVKDVYGTYWIGTKKGLNRIFENQVIKYHNNEKLRNKDIFFIAKDSLSQIWVATHDEIFIHDYESNNFTQLTYDSTNLKVYSYCMHKDGVLLSCHEYIYIYRYATRKVERLVILEDNLFICRSMHSINDTELLVCGDDQQLRILNIKTGALAKLNNIHNNGGEIYTFLDSHQRVWVSIFNEGLKCYSIKNNGALLNSFTTENSNLTNNTITDIKETNNKLWIATDGGGINILDMVTNRITPLANHLNEKLASQIKSTNIIYMDNGDDDIWLGSVRNGVINIQKTYIEHIEGLWRNKGVNSTVHTICEDSDNTIWFGTDGEGLHQYNPVTKRFKYIESTENKKITDIELIDNEWLLISAYNDGIYKVHKSNGMIISIPIVNKTTNNQIFNENLIIEFAKISNDKILILTTDIFLYNITQNKITAINNSGIVKNGGHTKAYVDNKQTIIHNIYNIYSIDNKSLKTSLLYSTPRPEILSVRKKDNILWLNTNNYLSTINLDTKQHSIIDNPYNINILSFEIDKRNNIWFTTYNELICMNINNVNKFISFDNASGFRENEFILTSTMLTKSGDIYLGGNKGLLTISKDTPIQSENEQKISLLAVFVDNIAITHNNLEEESTPTITIPWDYSSLNFNICVNNSNVFRENRFKYTINSTKKSTVIYDKNSLSLPTLLYGETEIQVSYLKNNGEWSSLQTTITIIVLPPWWSSMPFHILLLISVLGVFVIIFYKYHKRKQRYATHLHQVREQKLANNKIKFLINISHELKTPLTLIYAPLKRLLEKQNIDSEMKQQLTRIFAQSKYMSDLINMVLDIRKMEVGYGELDIQQHNFNDWIISTANEFIGELDAKQISLSFELSYDSTTLNFDESKCKRVLSNLLMNAYKYSDSKSHITIKSEIIDQKVRLSIIDQGVGLDGMDIDSLFNRFIQAHDKTGGTGIGLSYSKMLIELHPGGSIGAKVNTDVGSTFYFELPLNLECKVSICESKPYLNQIFDRATPMSNSEMDYSLENHTILIVEDNRELLLFLKDNLSNHFKKVYTAQDGESAYEVVKHDYPSIVVSDVMMPKMNGYDLCYNIKNNINVSHIPVLLLTAKTDIESKINGYKSGSDMYISKPFEITTLLLAIRNQLYTRDMIKRQYSNQNIDATPDNITFSNADEQFIIKLNIYITDNISNENLNVTSIINHMCMGRATFYKKLKALIDIGVMDYVVRQRMTVACELLLKTSDSIIAIATSVGYSDTQHFSKVFKQYYNLTPLQYRRNSLEQYNTPLNLGNNLR